MCASVLKCFDQFKIVKIVATYTVLLNFTVFAAAFADHSDYIVLTNECIPKKVLQSAIHNGIAIHKMHLQMGRTFKDSNMLVDLTDPGGLFFTLPPIDHNLRERFNEADMLIIITEVLRNEVCFSKNNETYLPRDKFERYIDYLHGYCPEYESLKSVCNSKPRTRCFDHEIYRSFDGTCNNIDEDFERGAMYATYLRVMTPAYHDDIMEIRRSHNDERDLPSARLLSTSIFPILELNSMKDIKGYDIVAPNMNSLFFFQTIIHDTAFLAGKKHGLQNHKGLQCCTTDRKRMIPQHLRHSACDAIKIPKDDVYFGESNITCMNFIRGQSGTKSPCSLSTAHPMNLVTSYLDGSFVYGMITKDQKSWMRTYSNGQLTMCNQNILPRNEDMFRTGDFRSGQSPQLSVIHSLFYREHNRIAKILHELNEFWNDEKLFQETRRIIIALLQQYTYHELLPTYVERDFLRAAGIIGDEMNNTCYNSKIDATALVEFNSALSRILHGFIPNEWQEIDDLGQVTSERVSDYFGFVDFLQTRYEKILRGILGQHLNYDGYPVEMLNYLFRTENEWGIDLLAYDIQRGRDHGLQPYHKYRSICNLSEIYSWSDLDTTFNAHNIEKLKSLYDSVFDIDLYVGAALESYAGFLSPTMKCFFKMQYRNLKCGDRFFYTSKSSPYPFTDDQLKTILNDSFARLICENSLLTHVPRNAFLTSGLGNREIACADMPELNLSLWKLKLTQRMITLPQMVKRWYFELNISHAIIK